MAAHKAQLVAQRYAKALAGLWSDKKKGPAVREELRKIVALIESHKELRGVVSSRIITGDKIAVVIQDISEKLGLSSSTQKALRLLAEMKRLGALAEIVNRWEELDLVESGTLPLVVESSYGLEAKEKTRIEEKFQSLLGKTVKASYALNSALIGGIRISAAGRTYDGSLKGWLNHLESRLVEGRL